MKKPTSGANAPQSAALEQALGYEFRKTELLTEALTHRSHHHEFGDSFHNERLEFLGDAVLDLCVTELIMEMSPMTDEGKLSKIRSQLVSEAALARAAHRLDLGKAVRLGKGEDQSGGRQRDSLLADTLEAVLAAVYIESGLPAVKSILMHLGVVPRGENLLDPAKTLDDLIQKDSKSRLQEMSQSLGYGAPTYVCQGSTGPDHSRLFTMSLMIQGIEVLRADGPTKKEATQRAAEKLIESNPDETSLDGWLRAKGLKPGVQRPRNARVSARMEK